MWLVSSTMIHTIHTTSTTMIAAANIENKVSIAEQLGYRTPQQNSEDEMRERITYRSIVMSSDDTAELVAHVDETLPPPLVPPLPLPPPLVPPPAFVRRRASPRSLSLRFLLLRKSSYIFWASSLLRRVGRRGLLGSTRVKGR